MHMLWVFVFLYVSHVLFFFHIGRHCPTNFNCVPVSFKLFFKQFASSLAFFFLWAPFISFKNLCASVYFIYFSTLSLFQLEIMQGQLDSLTWSVMLTVYVRPRTTNTHTHSLCLSYSYVCFQNTNSYSYSDLLKKKVVMVKISFIVY